MSAGTLGRAEAPWAGGDPAGAADDARRQLALRLGLWGFLGTATMLFAAFTSAYLVRQSGGDWVRIELPGVLWLNTGFLVVSSLALEVARREHGRERWRSAGVLVAAATLLGLAFLVGQVGAWRQLVARGIYLPSNPHASFFYTLTGVHGLHLLAGLVLLATVLVPALGRRRPRMPFELAATFWHFFGGVWIWLFLVLTVV